MMINKVVWDRLLAMGCVGVLCGILWAGLWPFTPHPANQVAWLENGNGLHFAGYGTILSSRAFPPTDAAAGSACSLEIWAEPSAIQETRTLLGFYKPENLVSFSLYQFRNGLIFERQIRNRQDHASKVHTGIEVAFHAHTPAFITVTASGQGTTLYLDGALVERSSRFGLSAGDLTGQLVIANSPVEDDSWSGDLHGLAIFDRELAAGEVLDHFNSWTKRGRPVISEDGKPIALYLFDERAGSVIHNRAGTAPDLIIPDHYLILHPKFLEVPWKEFYPRWSYFEDVLVNIAGFIPLGFVFCGYFSSARHLRRAHVMAIILGFMVSLTIEILQSYIPTRDSGMTDVITNTLGTAIGAMGFRWKITQAVFLRFGIPTEP